MLRKALKDFDADSYATVKAISNEIPDKQFEVHPPKEGLVLSVYSKILNGYGQPKNTYDESFQRSVGQDTLWIQAHEKTALIKAAKENGDVPAAIANRIARFNLIDNTRGEPDRWTPSQIEHISMRISEGVISGSAKLETKNGKRGYHAELRGCIKTSAHEVELFELVALGKFWGEGRFTGRAPEGKFPLAITFRLADDSFIKDVVPHGAKGWIEGYYQTDRK